MKKIVAVVVFLFIVAVSDAFGQTTADEWIKKADEYFDKGDYTNAITAYSEAIKKDNTNFDSYWGRGIAYYQIKNYNSAIADYNAALKINPNDDDILICRGSVYFDRKEYNAAVADYNAALKINPNNVFGYWSRAKAYFQMKNYDATIADLTTYINKNGTISNAYIMRGDAYGAKGIYHKAVADYRTGLEKGYDPSTFRVDKSNKADMWFCGAMYMEIIVNRFLGKSDVVTKYENWLKTVCDKNKVTRAEIEAFYRDNIRGLIAAVVDEEFNKISFFIHNVIRQQDSSFGGVLTRNPQNGQYELSYEGYFGANTMSVKKLSATSLEALLSSLSKSGEFSQVAIDTVKAQAALIPAVVLSDTALNEVKTILTNLFINPNATTYNAVREMYSLYINTRIETGRGIYEIALLNCAVILASFSDGLARKVIEDKNNSVTSLTADQKKRLLQLR